MTRPRQVPSAVPELVLSTLLGEGAECVDIGIAIYDDDGRYVAVNRKGCELLGYDRSEILARDVADFTEGGIDRSVLRSPSRREGARMVRRKDGHSFPVAFVVAPTTVGGIAFYLSAFWELAVDDPRSASAV